MADDSDDDLYGDSEAKNEQKQETKTEDDGSSGDEPMDEGQDSGDDDDDSDEDSESDLEIIIDKPASAIKAVAAQPQESKAIKIEAPPQTSSATPSSQAPKAATITTGGTVPQLLPGTAYPAQRTSTIDVNGNPVYPPQGKEIMSVDMEADMAEEQKIWRRPGEDQSDYFNYGFDEFTWEMYRQRQVVMAQTLQQQKNDMVQMQQMMGQIPGMPAMPGPAQGNAPAGAPSGPSTAAMQVGPAAMNEQAQMEMMFQQMASQGIDPSQMDFASFMQMAGGGMGGFGGPAAGQQGGGFQQGNPGGGGVGGGGGGGRGGRGRGRGW